MSRVLLVQGTRGIIAYSLRDEFGGYCSREQVRQFLEGEIDSLGYTLERMLATAQR